MKQLSTDYLTNQVAANTKYGNKRLAITGGTVFMISEGNVMVSDGISSATIPVICKYGENQRATVAKLRPSQPVTVIGRLPANTGVLILEDCRFETRDNR